MVLFNWIYLYFFMFIVIICMYLCVTIFFLNNNCIRTWKFVQTTAPQIIKGPFQLTFLCLHITALSFFSLLLFNFSVWGIFCSIFSSYFLVFTHSVCKFRNNYFNPARHLTNMFFLRFIKMLLLGLNISIILFCFRYFWLARCNYLIAQSKKHLYWLLIHFF